MREGRVREGRVREGRVREEGGHYLVESCAPTCNLLSNERSLDMGGGVAMEILLLRHI